MSVTIEIAGPCRKKLRIEVSTEEVADERAKVLHEFRRLATLPGFRPGKAPEPMVEKRFAKQIDEEVQEKVIQDSWREAIREHKLRPIGMLQVEKVEHQPGQPLIYTAVVDVAPEFALPEYKGISAQRKEMPVTDEDVAKMVDALRDEHADTLTVEDRGLKMGDYVHMDYTGIADGKPIVELVPDHTELGEYKGFWLLVESDAFLPGFCEQLLDARVGEKRQVLINFAADFGKKELAGRKATYFVDVTGIKEKKLPELNDEFAEKVGAKSLDELKKTVRKNMITQREKAVQNDVHNQIMDQLLKQTQFDLPESLVAAETRGIAHDLVREYTMHGVSREELEQRKSEIFSMATRNAKDRLRAAFILDAIAEKEKIEVEESEVNARIVQLAQHNRTTPERLKVQLMERGTLSQIENQIREGKTLDFLVTSAKVEVAK